MKKTIKKVISISLIVITFSLFVSSTVMYFVKRNDTKYYSISYDSYQNVSNLLHFEEDLKSKIGSTLDDMFIKNAGEIKTDNKGDITYLNIDCEVKQNDDIYNIQIKCSDKSEYTLIQTKVSESNVSKISLKDTLNALSYYDFNHSNDDYNYKFMIKNELINNIFINKNAKKQYVVINDSIKEVKSTMSGTFSRIDILLDNEFEELYFKI